METKLFRINHLTDEGRLSHSMGVFKANSKAVARNLAAEYYKDREIATLGFYEAEEVTQRQLDREYIQTMKELDKRIKILN